VTAPRSTRSTGARRWRLVRASPAAVPDSVRRFGHASARTDPASLRRARRRRTRALLPWAVAGAVLLVAGLATWILYGTSLLGVGQVRVTGVNILSPAQVRQAAAVTDGTPLARLDVAAVRARVAALAPVRRVVVSRDWPDTVRIQVTERTPVAAAPQGRRFVLVDDQGVAFQAVSQVPAKLPTMKVAKPGPGDANTRAAIAVMRALTPQLRDQLVSISVDGPARIRLALTKERVVIWGDSTESDLKARVATALLARDGTTFDVSAPDVVTIR
jgi:cell division protein FtsQ